MSRSSLFSKVVPVVAVLSLGSGLAIGVSGCSSDSNGGASYSSVNSGATVSSAVSFTENYFASWFVGLKAMNTDYQAASKLMSKYVGNVIEMRDMNELYTRVGKLSKDKQDKLLQDLRKHSESDTRFFDTTGMKPDQEITMFYVLDMMRSILAIPAAAKNSDSFDVVVAVDQSKVKLTGDKAVVPADAATARLKANGSGKETILNVDLPLIHTKSGWKVDGKVLFNSMVEKTKQVSQSKK